MAQTITEIDFFKNDLPGGYHVINTAEQYDSLINSNNAFVIIINLPWVKKLPEEKTSIRGEFDFNYDILVGVKKSFGGCNMPSVEIELIVDDNLKMYEIVFHTFITGNCRKANYLEKWFLISEVNKEYSLEYRVKNHFLFLKNNED